MLEKYYKHELVEKEIYESWEKDKDFVSFLAHINFVEEREPIM